VFRSGKRRDPFFSALSLVLVGVFVINNFWFKPAFPGFVTGKLSDACACFFLPLYLGYLTSGIIGGGPGRRAGYGAAVTVSLMVTVKATALGSSWLNAAVDAVSGVFGLHFAPNRADPTDLFTLPLCVFAVFYARRFELRAPRAACAPDTVCAPSPTASIGSSTS